MSRILSPRPLVALVVFAAAFAPAPAHALGAAFSCTAVTYQVVIDQLKIGTVDTTVSPATLSYTNVGAPNTSSYNGGGYNTVDNFIYAMSGLDELLKIDSDGLAEAHAVTGIETDANFVAGDISSDGQSLIAFDVVNTSMWSIDLDTFVGTNIGDVSTADVDDFAILSDAGGDIAYGIDRVTGGLVSFELTENPITVSVNSSVEIGAGSSKGAVWSDSSGNLTVFVNATGDVYSVTNPSDASPVVTKVASLGSASSQNDGMKCALAESAFPEPEPDSGSGRGPGNSSMDSAGALAFTGVSEVNLFLISLTGAALLILGNSIRRIRRREFPRD